MSYKNTYFDQDKYYKDLEIVPGVKFTPRELDVLSCVYKGKGDKTIGSILSIGKKTVEAHISSIKKKMGDIARENIVDVIDRSGKSNSIKQHYEYLLIQGNFEKCLKEISKFSEQNKATCILHIPSDQETTDPFCQRLIQDLEYAGIKTIRSSDKKSLSALLSEDKKYNIYFTRKKKEEEISQDIQKASKNSNNSIFLFLGEEESENALEELRKVGIITFKKEEYYLSFFGLLKKILPHKNLEKIILEFKEIYDGTSYPHDLTSPHTKRDILNKKNFFRKIIKRKNYTALASVFGVGVLFLGSIYFKQEDSHFHKIDSLKSKEDTLKNFEKPIRNKWKHKNIIYNLPPRNIYFTGRKKFLNKSSDNKGIITKTFDEYYDAKIALIGLPGMGKTQLAKEFAIQNENNYQLVWWFDCQKDIKEQYSNLCTALSKNLEINNINCKQSENLDVVNEIKNILKTININWLLIFDDIKDNEVVEKFLPQRDIGLSFKGHVIITSQNYDLQSQIRLRGIRTYKIETFTKDEAVNFLRKIISREDIDKSNSLLNELATILDRLPLALAQAASFIQYTPSMNIPIYIEKFKNKKEELWVPRQKRLKTEIRA